MGYAISSAETNYLPKVINYSRAQIFNILLEGVYSFKLEVVFIEFYLS